MMRPYDDGAIRGDRRNSTKTGQTASKCKRDARRIYKKIARAKAKREVRED